MVNKHTTLRVTFDIDMENHQEMGLARYILGRFKVLFAVTKPNQGDLETILQGRKLSEDHGKPTVVKPPKADPPALATPKVPQPYGPSYNGKIRVTPPCTVCDKGSNGSDWWCCPNYIHCARTGDGAGGLKQAERASTPAKPANTTVVTQRFDVPKPAYRITKLIDRKMPLPQWLRDKSAADKILLDNPTPIQHNVVES